MAKIKVSSQNDLEDFQLKNLTQSTNFIDRTTQFFKNSLGAVPLTLILTLVPLIVFMEIVKLSPEIAPHWTTDTNYDFFSYHKAWWLSILTIISVVVYFLSSRKNNQSDPSENKQMTLFYILSGTYIGLAFLSSITSSIRVVALWGFADRYEGFVILVMYIAIFILAYSVSDNEDALRFILSGLFISAAILTTIGIFQFFGMDLFKSYEGKMMILPAQYKDIADSLQFQFGAFTIYSTLYNTNYVGSYTVMLFMISFSMLFLVRNKWAKLFFALFTALMFSNWIGCLSRAGMVGGAAALVLFIIIFRTQVIKQGALFIGMIIIFISIFTIMNNVSNNTLLKQVSRLNVSTEKNTYNQGVVLETKDLKANNNTIFFTFNTGALNVHFENNKPLRFTDSTGKEISQSMSLDGSSYILNDKRFEGLLYKLDPNTGLVQFTLNNNRLNFVYNGKVGFVDRNGRASEIKNIEAIGFKGREKLASMRGYIWSRTIPLLKKTFIKGFGPDTYSIFFPQNDYLGKWVAYNDPYIIVDKPHNMYLQIAVNTGVLSLIALLVMFIYYFVWSLKLYINSKYSDFYSRAGVGIFIAFTGYLVTGIFNDSLISVAPVFWILFGLGISCNLRQKKSI